MSTGVNPAVQELLAEIARAKARAEARRKQREAAEHTQYGIIRHDDGRVELREPPPPPRPEPSDCCNSGCTPCIMDTYRDQLQHHRHQMQELRQKYHQILAGNGHVDDMEWHEQPKAPCGILDPLKFVGVRVMHVEDGEYWRLFVLEATSSDFVLGLGEHIHIRVQTETGGIVTRPFTPVMVDVEGLPRPHLFIRLYEGNDMSTYFRKVVAGDLLAIRGPIATNENLTRAFAGNSCVLVAGGSGVAPIFQILRFASLNAAYHDKRIIVIHCARDKSGLWLQQEIADIMAMMPGMTYKSFLSHNSHGGMSERLSAAAVQRILGDIPPPPPPGIEHAVRAVVCGPRQFNEDVAHWLRDAGVSEIQQL